MVIPMRHPGPPVAHPVWTDVSPTLYLQFLMSSKGKAFEVVERPPQPTNPVLTDTKATSILPTMYVV